MQSLKKYTTRSFSWMKKRETSFDFQKKKAMNKNKVIKMEKFHYKWKEDIVWQLLNLMMEMWL